MRIDKFTKYHRHLVNLANAFSKDKSSKVAAAFLDSEDFTVLTSGYNGFPRGCNDDLPERHERPLKYDFAEHAERNAIFNLARPYLQGAYVLTNEPLTMANARALISVGVSQVWATASQPVNDVFSRICQFFAEAGVDFYYRPDGLSHDGLHIRHHRKISQNLSVLGSLADNLASDPYATATVFLSVDEYTRLTEGYSGMPRGAEDAKTYRYEGEEREFWVEDSIRNAIYNKVRPLLKGSTAVVTHVPCTECARAIAAVGSRCIVAPTPAPDFLSRWAHHAERTFEMVRELDISYVELPSSVEDSETLNSSHGTAGSHA